LSIGAERQGSRAGGIGTKKAEGILNGGEFTVVQPEAYDVAATAGVEDIDEVTVLGDGVRFAASGRYTVAKVEIGTMNAKQRNVAAACIDGKKMRMILGQRQGALRFEGIVVPPLPRPPVAKWRSSVNVPSAFLL